MIDVEKIYVKPIFTVPDLMSILKIMYDTVKISVTLFYFLLNSSSWNRSLLFTIHHIGCRCTGVVAVPEYEHVDDSEQMSMFNCVDVSARFCRCTGVVDVPEYEHVDDSE